MALSRHLDDWQKGQLRALISRWETYLANAQVDNNSKLGATAILANNSMNYDKKKAADSGSLTAALTSSMAQANTASSMGPFGSGFHANFANGGSQNTRVDAGLRTDAKRVDLEISPEDRVSLRAQLARQRNVFHQWCRGKPTNGREHLGADKHRLVAIR